ncbi:MAG: hypothetical protein AAF135_13515 [Bacteroidota bacterium]
MKLSIAFIFSWILIGGAFNLQAQSSIAASVATAFHPTTATWNIQPAAIETVSIEQNLPNTLPNSASGDAPSIFEGEDAAAWEAYESEVYTSAPTEEDTFLMSYLSISNSQAPAQSVSRDLPEKR